MELPILLLLLAEGLLAFLLLYVSGLVSRPIPALLSAVLLAGALALRALGLDYETLDYQDFLSQWVAFFRDNGGFRALAQPVGNYNIPYLYFLALFSYSGIRDLYLIKLLSILFDLLLAWACALLLGAFTESRAARLGLFFAVLYLPTVILNGSVWAQCDSLYVAFAVLGLALALKDRPALSMVCAAVSFGIKLQAVFLLPVYAVLWLAGRVKLRHVLLFPVSYVLLVLPAVLLGRPFLGTLTLYLDQTGSVGSGLNYNSPSVFGILWRLPESETTARLAVAAAFALMLAVLLAAVFCRRRLNDRAVLGAALLFVIGIPFLLPHMHDRYFYLADILTLVLAFVCLPAAAAAPLSQFASLLGYYAYFKMAYLLPMRYGSWALILAFLLSLGFFVRSLRQGPAPAGKISS